MSLSSNNVFASLPHAGNVTRNQAELSVLFNMIRHIEDADVLDLGCGNGTHIPFFIHERAGKITGVDASSHLIAEAQSSIMHNDVTFICEAIETYQAPKESLDIVISYAALDTTANLKTVFRNVYQALRPDGQFVFSVTHPLSSKHHTISYIINSLIECGFVIQRIEEMNAVSGAQPGMLIVKVQKNETAI